MQSIAVVWTIPCYLSKEKIPRSPAFTLLKDGPRVVGFERREVPPAQVEYVVGERCRRRNGGGIAQISMRLPLHLLHLMESSFHGHRTRRAAFPN